MDENQAQAAMMEAHLMEVESEMIKKYGKDVADAASGFLVENLKAGGYTLDGLHASVRSMSPTKFAEGLVNDAFHSGRRISNPEGQPQPNGHVNVSDDAWWAIRRRQKEESRGRPWSKR